MIYISKGFKSNLAPIFLELDVSSSLWRTLLYKYQSRMVVSLYYYGTPITSLIRNLTVVCGIFFLLEIKVFFPCNVYIEIPEVKEITHILTRGCNNMVLFKKTDTSYFMKNKNKYKLNFYHKWNTLIKIFSHYLSKYTLVESVFPCYFRPWGRNFQRGVRRLA